jgi:hypothetical protein
MKNIGEISFIFSGKYTPPLGMFRLQDVFRKLYIILAIRIADF